MSGDTCGRSAVWISMAICSLIDSRVICSSIVISDIISAFRERENIPNRSWLFTLENSSHFYKRNGNTQIVLRGNFVAWWGYLPTWVPKRVREETSLPNEGTFQNECSRELERKFHCLIPCPTILNSHFTIHHKFTAKGVTFSLFLFYAFYQLSIPHPHSPWPRFPSSPD